MNTNSPAKRTPLHLNISFRTIYARKDSHGLLTDISLTGAFMQVSERDLRAGDKIALRFIVGDRDRSIAAKVVWKKQEGVGICFNPKNNRDIQIIDDLIYYIEKENAAHRER